MEFAFFGSGVLWLLITFPAYWLFQWMVEGEPFTLWHRSPGQAPTSATPVTATSVTEHVSQTLADATATLSAATNLVPSERATSR